MDFYPNRDSVNIEKHSLILGCPESHRLVQLIN